MLEHRTDTVACWCRPVVEDGGDVWLILHRGLDLMPDPVPRATGLLLDGAPV